MERKNATRYILMVSPVSFGYNPETAQDNAFQNAPEQIEASDEEACGLSPATISGRAVEEFNEMVELLKSHGVNVVVVFDTPEPKKPDAVFPNNWFSTHEDGTVVLYPMKAPARRWERRRGVINLLEQAFAVQHEIDLSHYEEDSRFLEGTGSMVLDRPNRICYACISQRTDEGLLREFGNKLGYRVVAFHSADAAGRLIYHTNVMMAIGTHFAMVCLESVQNPSERQMLKETLISSGKEVIELSLEQVGQFAGNALEVLNAKGESLLVLSARAKASLTPQQISAIERYATIVAPRITLIEDIGGGSVRCMMAEVYLPERV